MTVQEGEPALVQGESAIKPLRHPRQPTEEEYDDHVCGGHSVYRSWCRACVASRGRDDRHMANIGGKEDAIPTISLDYAFLGDGSPEENEKTCAPVLVIKDHLSRAMSSNIVPFKGSGHDFPVNLLK